MGPLGSPDFLVLAAVSFWGNGKIRVREFESMGSTSLEPTQYGLCELNQLSSLGPDMWTARRTPSGSGACVRVLISYIPDKSISRMWIYQLNYCAIKKLGKGQRNETKQKPTLLLQKRDAVRGQQNPNTGPKKALSSRFSFSHHGGSRAKRTTAPAKR